MRKIWRWTFVGALIIAIVGVGAGRSATNVQGLSPMPDRGIPYVFFGNQAGNGLAGDWLAGNGLTGEARDAQFVHGCWFSPPAPPSCATCADNCNPGQNCCIIIRIT